MTDIKLLPPPKWLLEGFTDPTIEMLCDYTRANVAHATATQAAEIESLRAELREAWSAVDSKAGWEWKKRAEQAEAEIESLRSDKSDLEAALEYLKAHRENATMNQKGIIKALSEVRDEQGAEVHRLQAELETAKDQAEYSRITRNWNQQKARRLEEAEAEVSALRAEREVIGDEAVKYAEKSGRLEAKVYLLAEALRIAEAALADIGDADREPGDDVEWCERRASLGLRRVRDTLRDHDKGASFRPSTPKP